MTKKEEDAFWAGKDPFQRLTVVSKSKQPADDQMHEICELLRAILSNIKEIVARLPPR